MHADDLRRARRGERHHPRRLRRHAVLRRARGGEARRRVLLSCAVQPDGAVRCWGDNTYGQVGDGTTFNRYEPTLVRGISAATSVATGESFACALLADGTVECWGYNNFGQLGDGTTTNRTTPVSVAGVTNAVSIAAGQNHACARLADGTAAAGATTGTASSATARPPTAARRSSFEPPRAS